MSLYCLSALLNPLLQDHPYFLQLLLQVVVPRPYVLLVYEQHFELILAMEPMFRITLAANGWLPYTAFLYADLQLGLVTQAALFYNLCQTQVKFPRV